ncbi:Glutathione transport system permease protein GsiD [Baekduia alba]|uniref:ABC transporter permease n=1 Tax=Baekduia alba TaxID=2997333 RepID=UPI002341EA98|nr:ABC transporter permease [Baekduia alba]WCB97008.1 Glutathione transport system permease protein GsiD [Baekduia alba]
MSTGTPESLLESEPVDLTGESAADIAARSPLELFWRRLRRDKVALVALAIVLFMVFVAIFAPLIVKVFGLPNPRTQNDNLLDDFGSPTGPSGAHPFGVDERGRDVLSRVIYGSRVSLEVAFIATALIVIIGVTAGLTTGYYRGKVDTLISRVMDLFLAFPVLVLAVGLGVACADGCLGGAIQPGLPVIIFVITLTTWPYMARIVRGQVLSLREREFVEASRSLGASDARIIFREILPNLIAPIIVYATVLIPQNILYEAALSFLGVGVDPSKPSWGAMISDATSIFQDAWWFMVFPGLALLITVLAFNIVGDGLQDALNPRTSK